MSRFTAYHIFCYGLKHTGHEFTKGSLDQATKHDNRRFYSSYGLTPETIKAIFDDLQTLDIGQELRIQKPNIKFLLMTLNWWKEYRTENNMAGHWKVSEKTFEKHVWAYTRAIQAISKHKIKWPFDGDNLPKEIFVLSVDGVHFKILEMRQTPDKDFKSVKLGRGAAVSYELALSIWQGKLVWINGPFPAGVTDLVIYKKPGGLKSKIPPGKRLIGDKIYLTKNTPEISGRNLYDDDKLGKFKERVKARHETFNRRIKSFNILDNRFRSKTDRMQKHKSVMTAICVAVQYDMENGRPLFDI